MYLFIYTRGFQVYGYREWTWAAVVAVRRHPTTIRPSTSTWTRTSWCSWRRPTASRQTACSIASRRTRPSVCPCPVRNTWPRLWVDKVGFFTNVFWWWNFVKMHKFSGFRFLLLFCFLKHFLYQVVMDKIAHILHILFVCRCFPTDNAALRYFYDTFVVESFNHTCGNFIFVNNCLARSVVGCCRFHPWCL